MNVIFQKDFWLRQSTKHRAESLTTGLNHDADEPSSSLMNTGYNNSLTQSFRGDGLPKNILDKINMAQSGQSLN